MRMHHLFAGVCSLLCGVSVSAGNRMNLPQVTADLTVNGKEFRAIFDVQGDNQALAPQLTQALVGVLPEDFRKGCHDMVPDFGPMAAAQTTWGWSIRLLHAELRGAEQSALLALRCTVHVPDVTVYDERLALLVSGQRTALKLIAFDKDCANCSDLYHLKFLQSFKANSGYLAGLSEEHTTVNPCCDGGDLDFGERWLLIGVPSGRNVLTFDKEATQDNHDDENGDTQTKCEAKVQYEGDLQGNLKAVVATTTCAENGKAKPPVTSRYLWNASSGRFEEQIQSTASTARR